MKSIVLKAYVTVSSDEDLFLGGIGILGSNFVADKFHETGRRPKKFFCTGRTVSDPVINSLSDGHLIIKCLSAFDNCLCSLNEYLPK